MATTEELFISIPQESYRKSKSAGLQSQAELLRSLRHLQNLKVLSRQKIDLKKQLHKKFASLEKQIDALQKNMPTPSIPKTVSSHKIKTKAEPFEAKKTFSKRDEIEEELMQIQAKLQKLNA